MALGAIGPSAALPPTERPIAEAPLLRLVATPHGSTWLFLDGSTLGIEVRALPGKGLGVIAGRAFRSGERIFAELPLVAWESSPRPSGGHDWGELEALVASLSEESQRDFYDLFDKHAEGGGAATAQGIWNSNSHPTVDIFADGRSAATDGVRRSAVFRLCSRFNHACRPSSYAAWNAGLGRLTVHALRDIARGEEITIAYVGGAEAGTREQRQAILRDKYRFECDCKACCLTGEALERSEARQRRMAEIHAALLRPPSGLAALVEELLELMRAEQLPLVWAKAGLFLAIVQLKGSGHLAAVAQMAARGAAASLQALGDDSSVYRKFASLAAAFGEAAAAGHGGLPAAAFSANATDATTAATTDPAATDPAAATNEDATATAVEEEEEEEPRTRTYEVGAGTQNFERGAAEGWPAEAGPRVLQFQLVSHRQRWAHRVWPAAQVLSRWLDAHPALAAGQAVLEIGAGAALPSVVAALLGACAVVVSDWPDPKMLHNMKLNLAANLPPHIDRRATVVGYNWNKSPQPLLDELGALGGGAAFGLILLADLLYECEHEPILSAVAACLAKDAPPFADATDGTPPYPRALLTYQVHDRCQATKQAAFFDLAPSFGLMATRLLTVEVGRQFEEEAEEEDEGEEVEEEEEMEGDDITKQVQLWELVHLRPCS